MRTRIAEWFISIVFAIIGAGIIIGGVYMQIEGQAFKKESIKASATITEIDIRKDSDGDVSHDVYIAYSIGGRKYSGILGEYSPDMRVGGRTTIYYKPDNPGDFRGGSVGYIGLLLIAFGLVFFLVGGLMIFFKIKGRISAHKLMETGRRLDANIDTVDFNYSYRVNGRHPMVITCTYVDPFTRKVFTFRSDNLWFAADTIVESAGITTLPVYMDEEKPSRYYVDTGILNNYIGN